MKYLTSLLSFVPGLSSVVAPLLNPWVLLAFALYSAALVGFSGFQGYRLGMSELHEYIGKQAAETVNVIRKIETVKEIVRIPHIQKEIQIQTRFVHLEREAVNVPSRVACNVTVGWVRFHNAAADNQDRRVEGAVDDATDSGVTEAHAAATVAANYKAFHQVANDLTACRGFVSGVSAVTERQP